METMKSRYKITDNFNKKPALPGQNSGLTFVFLRIPRDEYGVKPLTWNGFALREPGYFLWTGIRSWFLGGEAVTVLDKDIVDR